MEIPSWLMAGGLLTMLAALWNQVRWAYGRIVSSVVAAVEIEDYSLFAALSSFSLSLKEVGPRSICYQAEFFRLRSRKTELVAGRKLPPAGRFVWFRNSLVFVTPSPESTGSTSSSPSSSSSRNVFRLIYLRGWTKPDDFVKDAVKHYNDNFVTQEKLIRSLRIKHRYGVALGPMMRMGEKENLADVSIAEARSIVRNSFEALPDLVLTHDPSELSPPDRANDKGESCYVYEGEALKIRREFQAWLKLRDWYATKGAVWRRSWLLAGPPGLGKTLLVRELAQDFNVPIDVFHLASMTDEDLQNHWTEAQRTVPKIVLIEEIDKVFDLDRPQQNVCLTFDALLSTLDGVSDNHGIALFMTTNHPDRIDPAIAGNGQATRPGRIDYVAHFEPLALEGRTRMVQQMIPEYPELHAAILADPTRSPAQVFGECQSIALHKEFERLHAEETAA